MLTVSPEQGSDRPAPEEPLAPTVLLLRAGRDAERHLGAGWSVPERLFCWTEGQASTLLIAPPDELGDCLLRLDVHTIHALPQRLSVAVNGCVIGDAVVSYRGSLLFRVPARIVAGKPALVVTLHHPDAWRPCDLDPSNPDDRLLAFMVGEVRLTPVGGGVGARLPAFQAQLDAAARVAPNSVDPTIDRAAIMADFQSLGNNCEFGLMQRANGVEVLGLFRFAGMALEPLVDGLRTMFAGIADRADIELIDYAGRSDHTIRHLRYNMEFHTGRLRTDISSEQILAEQPQRLRFLARLLLAELRSGEKLFVVKGAPDLLPEQILLLLDAMQELGPAVLLWVRPADPDHPSGSVAVVNDRLIVGHIASFAPLPVEQILYGDWETICRAAHHAWRQNLAPEQPRQSALYT